jgi:hypothetical protein
LNKGTNVGSKGKFSEEKTSKIGISKFLFVEWSSTTLEKVLS